MAGQTTALNSQKSSQQILIMPQIIHVIRQVIFHCKTYKHNSQQHPKVLVQQESPTLGKSGQEQDAAARRMTYLEMTIMNTTVKTTQEIQRIIQEQWVDAGTAHMWLQEKQ